MGRGCGGRGGLVAARSDGERRVGERGSRGIRGRVLVAELVAGRGACDEEVGFCGLEWHGMARRAFVSGC